MVQRRKRGVFAPIKNNLQKCAITQKDRLIRTVFLFENGEMGRGAYPAFS